MLFEVCNFTYTEPFGLQNMVVEMCVQPNLWCIFTRFPLLQRKKIHFQKNLVNCEKSLLFCKSLGPFSGWF